MSDQLRQNTQGAATDVFRKQLRHRVGSILLLPAGLRRKTIKKRMLGSLREIKLQLRRRLHDPISKTGQWLQRVLLDHLNYFAVPGNLRSIQCFFIRVRRMWLRSLRRRSQRSRMNWNRFAGIWQRIVPTIPVSHDFPDQRFDATT